MYVVGGRAEVVGTGKRGRQVREGQGRQRSGIAQRRQGTEGGGANCDVRRDSLDADPRRKHQEQPGKGFVGPLPRRVF